MTTMSWKQPIPTEIPELRDNPFAEQIFCTALRLAANTTQEIRLTDGTHITLQRGQCLFGRASWNKRFGLPVGSQKIERELSRSPFLNSCLNRCKTNKYSVFTIENYDEWTSLNSNLNNRQTTDKQQINTHKSVESDKNVKNKEKKKRKENPAGSISILKHPALLQALQKQFPWWAPQVIQTEIDKAYDWLSSKGKVYKNYVAFMRNWMRRIDETKPEARRNYNQRIRNQAEWKQRLAESPKISVEQSHKQKAAVEAMVQRLVSKVSVDP